MNELEIDKEVENLKLKKLVLIVYTTILNG